MKKIDNKILIGGAIGLVAIMSSKSRRPVDCSLSKKSGGEIAGVKYKEVLRGGASTDERLPMVIFLHGVGSSATFYSKRLKGFKKSRVIIPSGIYSEPGGGRAWFRDSIKEAEKRPAKELRKDWGETAERLYRFIRDIKRCRPTKGRIVLTGYSQGAELALLLGNKNRNIFDSIIILNGALPKQLWNPRLPKTWMLNGVIDKVVPYQWAKEYATEMKKRGARIEWNEYGTGHLPSEGMMEDFYNFANKRINKING